MKILKLQLEKLRNSEYIQFYTEAIKVIDTFDADALKIKKYYTPIVDLLKQADDCQKQLLKSNYTEDIGVSDRFREDIFRGLVNTTNAGLTHFDMGVRASAKRVKNVLDRYGNLTKKTNKEETADINNLTKDLEEKCADDVHVLNAMDWVQELKAANEQYSNLVEVRYTESSEKSEAKMKEVRSEIDPIYRRMIDTIDALANLTDEEEEIQMYKDFITKFNVIVEDYQNTIAQRDGVNKAKKEDEGTEGTEEPIPEKEH